MSFKKITPMKSLALPTVPFLLILASCSGLEDSIPAFDQYNYVSTMTGIPPEMAVTGDRYNEIVENPFMKVAEQPVSTFSIDADGASYSNTRRFIRENYKPPADAVRTEELINYFPLDYPVNNTGHPVSLNGEIAACPWAEGHKLIRIGISGKDIPSAQLPPANFVLLIDVSGSMSSPDKLDLLKEGFMNLVDEFSANDQIAIVTYAGSAGVVLESTSGSEKGKIKSAITSLGSGGSTAGAAGIVKAYEIARQHYIEEGHNRVILGTDGDFNVGVSDQEELVELIETHRDTGIFLTILGVGRGNLNDGALEQIANKGNGNYEYIDQIEQANKVFIHEYNKFFTVAKDVKVQVEFNPDLVDSYRLIGYENRLLEEDDFEDDSEDAGEIGAGQTITALYEIIPRSQPDARYLPAFTIKFRYKNPEENTSNPLSLDIYDEGKAFLSASNSMVFTASVAGFGMLLRDSQYKGSLSYGKLLEWTSGTLGFDPHGYREEFRTLIQRARNL
ncbi:MAG: VWA domain-containing protein [Cyclobacteriaceae bacterium]|nr:VWA domain-containing protein [Cyclobacteriaceae bacterium]